MAGRLGDLFRVETGGGIAAHHPVRESVNVFVGPSTSSELNTVRLGLAPVACVRLDDIRFEFDSSFVGPKAADELKLVARLRIDIPGILSSVFGHADPVGDDVYNKKLSGRRAAAVYGLLTRRVEIWEDIFSQTGKFTNPLPGDKWGDDALRVMLDTLLFTDQPLSEAVRAFQKSPAGAGLKPDGDPGPKTRAKLFEAYMKAICVDDSGADFKLATTEFLAHGQDKEGKGDYQGCSEFNPVRVFSKAQNAAFKANPDHTERNRENQINRRVLIFFFLPGKPIDPTKWPCPRVKEGVAACHARFYSDGDHRRDFHDLPREYKDTRNTPESTFACRFYDRLAFESPCEIGLLIDVNLLRVHLKLVWQDPDPAKPPHAFPKDFPVVVVFADGSFETLKTGADGRLDFETLRSKKSFTLNFEFFETPFLATPKDTTQPERFLSESDIKAVEDGKHFFYSLPLNASGKRWELADWDWTVTGAATFNNQEFQNLNNTRTVVGSDSAPALLTLNPHWHFYKFTYFDRKLKVRDSIPAITLEGFRDAAAASGKPDTRSNWTVAAPKFCQCLPWVQRRAANKSAEPKPDNKVLLQFQTDPDTFIEASDSGGRKILSGTARNKPEAERLRFYDLPRIWKSRKYFARRADNTGDLFENRAAEGSGAGDPLIFSLDDIVLTDENLTPVTWDPAKDRAAIFSNTFKAGTNLSSAGMYKPDNSNPGDPDTGTYLTQKVDRLTTTNYIVDYPDWTRLVIAQGNIFDAFDKRTPDKDGELVGARAAVNWIDSPLIKAPGDTSNQFPNLSPRPAPPGEFCVVEAFYEQDHPSQPAATASVLSGSNTIGRYDMAILRCCDLEGDVEVAICLQYFRFHFDFNPSFKADFNPNAAVSGLTGAAARTYIEGALQNMPKRWNGPDGKNTPGPAVIVPQKAGDPKLKIQVLWVAQHLPKAISHYEIGVFKETTPNTKIRAFMSSFRGQGVLDITDNAPDPKFAGSKLEGRFTFAHESGHGNSLQDEYIETSLNCSYFQDGFKDHVPGDPYDFDETAMMRENVKPRPRHFWHIAEWLNSIYKIDFKVKHGSFEYQLPRHPDHPKHRVLVTWPLDFALNATSGATIPHTSRTGNYDAYVFRLGAEEYSATVLDKGPWDSILIVIVKMVFTFLDTNTHATIRDTVSNIAAAITRKFNGKFLTSGTAKGEKLARCRLRVSPRFLVRNFSGDTSYKNSVGVVARPGPPPVSEAEVYAEKVRDIIALKGKHFEVEIRNSGSSGWTTVVVPKPTGIGFEDEARLRFNIKDDSIDDLFPRFFANMIGLADGTLDAPASYQPIVKKVVPDGTVQKIT